MATKDEILEAIATMTVLDSASCSRTSRRSSACPRPPPRRPPPLLLPRRRRPRPRKRRPKLRRRAHRAGDKKIPVIKEVRTLTSLGLKEAKDWSTAPPPPSSRGAKEDAEKAKEALEAAGGSVELK